MYTKTGKRRGMSPFRSYPGHGVDKNDIKRNVDNAYAAKEMCFCMYLFMRGRRAEGGQNMLRW